jgi:ABC-type lipoprotein release transport system permease subunit
MAGFINYLVPSENPRIIEIEDRSLAKARAFTFVCAVLASLAPARRDASVQPMVAMRST